MNNMQEKKFCETDIFRTTSLLFRETFNKIKNVELDVKRSVGDEFLAEIKRCCCYAKLSWIEQKGNKKNKLKYMLLARREIMKAECDLNLIVSAGLFPGKKKNNEDEYVYLNGGSEISKNMGMLLIQLNSFISELEKSFTSEELSEIYYSIEIK